MTKFHDKTEKPDGKQLKYFQRSKFQFSALQRIFLPSIYSFFLSIDAGNYRINNATGYEGTKRKQSLITTGCADILKQGIQTEKNEHTVLDGTHSIYKESSRNQNENQTLF